MSSWLDGHRMIKKAASAVVLIAFFAGYVLSMAWAAMEVPEEAYDIPVSAEDKFAPLDVDTFTIPAHLGEIRYSFKGDPNKVIIHIQDAHANRFAQRKVSDIIDYVTREYGVRIVNLEGGAGEYDLSVFTSISGKAIRMEVADYFLKKGDINGAEFFAINNPGRVDLWGVEDKDLYLANLKVYRDYLLYKEEVDRYLKELSHIVNNLKRHIYNTGLLKLDINYSAFKRKKIEFREYLEFILERAKAHRIRIDFFENLDLLRQSIEKEEQLDFEAANKERKLLVDELKKRLSKEESRELLDKTLSFKTNRISQKAFYNYLLEKGRQSGLDEEDYPTLRDYLEYVSTYEAVNRFKIMEELDMLEAEIKRRIFKDDTQRELSILSKNLTLMMNIFDIDLNKTDYKYYINNRETFEVGNYLGFFDQKLFKYRIAARPSETILRLDGYRNDLTQFFEFSFKRDQVFLKNMKIGPTPTGIESAFIMTGGFHTENICQLFEKGGMSYVSIQPRFTMEKGYQSPYFEILAGETTSVQQVLQSVLAQATMLQIASKLNALGEAVWGREGINAYKASIKVRALIVRGLQVRVRDLRGREVLTLGEENKPVVFLGANDVADIIAERKNIIPQLAEEKRETVPDDDRKEAVTIAAGWLRERASDLGNLGYVDAAGRIGRVADAAEELRDKPERVRLFADVRGFKGFTDEEGNIDINRDFVWDRDTGAIDRRKLASLLVRQVMAGFARALAAKELVDNMFVNWDELGEDEMAGQRNDDLTWLGKNLTDPDVMRRSPAWAPEEAEEAAPGEAPEGAPEGERPAGVSPKEEARGEAAPAPVTDPRRQKLERENNLRTESAARMAELLDRDLGPIAVLVGRHSKNWKKEEADWNAVAGEIDDVTRSVYGQNIRVLYYDRDDPEGLEKARGRALRWNSKAQVIAYVDTGMIDERIEDFLKMDNVVGAVKHTELAVGQWLEDDLLALLAAALIQLKRDAAADRWDKELAARVSAFMKELTGEEVPIDEKAL
ncbi:MAG: hypothetical protein PVH45_00245, partial [Candidatus Omnitrophota bacterium]